MTKKKKPNRETITRTELARLFQGATHLAPGIWIDANEDLHFSIPDLLNAFGWPDDAKHRALVEQVIYEIVEQEFPQVPTTVLMDVEEK